MTYILDKEKLASFIKGKRGRKGLRDTAKEIGNVSPSTISRIENFKTPDLETFLALCNWMDINPNEFIISSEGNTILCIPEKLASILLSDKNLDPLVCNALIILIKKFYYSLYEEKQ